MKFPRIHINTYAQSILILFMLILFSCRKEKTNTPETCVGELHISPGNYNTDSVTVFAPNIFSPDGHGGVMNNFFYFTTTGITKLETKIYKNGVEVFESDDLYEGWDGKINGKVDHGLYHYSATATTIHNQQLQLSGFIRSIYATDPVSNCEACRFSDQIVPGQGFVQPTAENLKCR